MYVSRCSNVCEQVYSLPGVTKGPQKSYLKWVKEPLSRDLEALSVCMRCRKEGLVTTPQQTNRFNPSQITSGAVASAMTLAAVMNGVGNGNKDEVNCAYIKLLCSIPSSTSSSTSAISPPASRTPVDALWAASPPPPEVRT